MRAALLFFTMVLFGLFAFSGVSIFGLFLFIGLWGVIRWSRKSDRICTLVAALYRSKVAAIFGSLILAVLGAYLVIITTLAVFPKSVGHYNTWINIFIKYSGAISFFVFWIVGIVISLRTKSPPA